MARIVKQSTDSPLPQIFPKGNQCPNCGGYKIDSKLLDKQGVAKKDSIKPNFFGVAKVNPADIRYLEKFSISCRICGYVFIWSNTEPYPKIIERPDLIAKVETQSWMCSYCGSSNDGTKNNCYVCTYPKPQ